MWQKRFCKISPWREVEAATSNGQGSSIPLRCSKLSFSFEEMVTFPELTLGRIHFCSNILFFTLAFVWIDICSNWHFKRLKFVQINVCVGWNSFKLTFLKVKICLNWQIFDICCDCICSNCYLFWLTFVWLTFAQSDIFEGRNLFKLTFLKVEICSNWQWNDICLNWHLFELALVWNDICLDWNLFELKFVWIDICLNWHLFELNCPYKQMRMCTSVLWANVH